MIVNAQALRLPLSDASVDACLTSPPYWGGLRAYAGPQDREWPAISYSPMPGLPAVEIPAQAVALGHEPNPFAFVGHLLQVFREVRRVLRPGAALAVNLGDCYSADPKAQTWDRKNPSRTREYQRPDYGLPGKNLLLMPWRFALAMQADGWILRSRMPGGIEMEPDVVWWKRSCMPESVRDRPTVDFEDVLIFAQETSYFWDQEAGREEGSQTPGALWWRQNFDPSKGRKAAVMKSQGVGAGQDGDRRDSPAGRNMRSVWTINPEPTDEEHFAAWPVELASRLIRVMTSERGRCPKCGAPWERDVERSRCLDGVPTEGLGTWDTGRGAPTMGAQGVGHWRFSTRITDNGWRATCDHEAEPVPCRVLDPFAGLGRTWEAATATGRRFVGADLGLGYCRLALARNDLEAMARRQAARKMPTIRGPLFEEAAR